MNINLTQSQKILLTPQLEYSLNILKMSKEELLKLIDEEMRTNPLLEYAEDSSKPIESDLTYKVYKKELTNNKEYVNYNRNEDYDEQNYINSIPDILSLKPSLTEYLMIQLHTIRISKEEQLICEFLIESIDSNGYLTINVLQAASLLKVNIKSVKRAIKTLQSFDPPGIAAMNLKECLLIQLNKRNIQDDIIYKLIEEHLEDIAANKIPYLSQVFNLEIEQINKKIELIKGLNPRPGNEFSIDQIRYIKPDVIVNKQGDYFDIVVNNEQLSSININSYYYELLSKNKDLDGKEYDFINKNFNNGTWLIRCIEQRFQTLEKVTRAIVLNQMDFFCFGKKHLKPLTLKKIANDLDLHESTISRAVNEKYLLCRWGIFELKYFFSSTKIKGEKGKDISSSYVKLVLKQIIDSEDKKNPLSDTEIVKILEEKEISISRRTVAKYRAQLNIPSIGLRKIY